LVTKDNILKNNVAKHHNHAKLHQFEPLRKVVVQSLARP
jgi:hypothetical protein